MLTQNDDSTIDSAASPQTAPGLAGELYCTVSSLPPRFETKSLLGQGGAGIVVEAFDHELSRLVAVKLLTVGGLTDAQTQQRFLREAKALANLTHPNIVKILASDLTATGQAYHVMELLRGTSLGNEIELSGAFTIGKFLRLMRQVVAGLAHAHEHGVVHRDLKPNNIMIVDTESATIVKIIDFGIARFEAPESDSVDTQGITRTGCLLGSPMYMSPEQCQAKKVDHLSDIYSLGCIMLECLSGHPPFQGNSALQTMAMHLHEPAPSLHTWANSEGAKRLSQLIDRCLLKEREQRPQSIVEIQEELQYIEENLADGEDSFTNPVHDAEVSSKKSIVVPLLLSIVFMILVGFGLADRHQRTLERREQAKKNAVALELRRQKNMVEELNTRKLLKRTLDHFESQLSLHAPEVLDKYVQNSVRLAQYHLRDRSYGEAMALYDRARSFCLLDDQATGMLRMWLFVCSADCHRREGKYNLAEEELSEAKQLAERHSPCVWFYLRSRISLDVAENNWDKLQEHVAKLPDVWCLSTFQLVKDMVAREQFEEDIATNYRDELTRVEELIQNMKTTSASDAAKKRELLAMIGQFRAQPL